ncbi:hypothetical protein F6V30_10705 [Oryzomonas sagensis]|uniref:Uncharacterized protein n=1 Tax=Oryzomonas sagensis TaxID=2603857 RepID=A0ABQ6TLJ7_9BACT|nr:hypothetical protein [Oryzomonas sagensis]KAB0669285.1 hypothetical protein F6V30_10705 [Oryzomonas sagensis]
MNNKVCTFNIKQKITLSLALIVMAVMGIFPPWYAHFKRSTDSIQSKIFYGYDCIIQKYNPNLSSDAGYVEVNMTVLVIQWLVVIFFALALVIILSDDRK